MLPGDAYASARVFEWEQRHVFAGSWTCVGRAVPAVTTMRVGDVGVIVTPQRRAFANVCRHRGHELTPTGTSLLCPYHGWAYNIDGTLKSAPRINVDKTNNMLTELPCVDWHGWVFVNATATAGSSATAGSFEEHVGSLDALVAPYRPARLEVKARHEYEVRANWKVITENYHECYHCPLIHPELCAVSPPTSGNNWRDEPGNWVGGAMDLREHAETMSLDGRSRGAFLPGVDPRTVRYLGLFPNLLISLHPDYVLTHLLRPVAADRTLVECEWLFDPAVTDPSYALEFWDLVNRQDWAACESVQRGVSSPHFIPGPLAPNETAVYDWLQLVARAYQAA